MEAIILAGGFGTRLRPLTYTRAKSLLPIMNKPMISYLINMLPSEVDTIILAVNYQKRQIEKYLQSLQLNKNIIVNDEPEPLGTGGAVKFAESHLTDRFLVLNSDIICSLDLTHMIQFHKRKDAMSTISLWPVENVSEFGVVDMKDGGHITGFVEKPKPEDAPSNLINAGAYLLEREILDYIEPGKLVSMEKEIFPQIIKDTNRFYGYQFDGYWMDIGRITSYLNVHEFLLDKEDKKNHIGSHCRIQGDIRKTVLGNHVQIGKDTLIRHSIILDNATIGDDCRLDHCVIGENAKIDSKSVLNYVVLGDNELLLENSSKENQLIWTQAIPERYPKKQIGNVIGE
ncbi:MAG: NDP-sugar synthase [Candidatus Thermoplasmatota archaeon]|nr:NDP-sugar synthase [Candidatus Thermoplasmatota archaeon]